MGGVVVLRNYAGQKYGYKHPARSTLANDSDRVCRGR